MYQGQVPGGRLIGLCGSGAHGCGQEVGLVSSGPSEETEEPHLWEGLQPKQVPEEENVVALVLGCSRKAEGL